MVTRATSGLINIKSRLLSGCFWRRDVLNFVGFFCFLNFEGTLVRVAALRNRRGEMYVGRPDVFGSDAAKSAQRETQQRRSFYFAMRV